MKDKREKEIIEIEFTEDLLNICTDKYMKKHPRAKKKPLQFSSHPSLNTWIILKRPSMNALKQKWADFTEFVVDYYGLRDLGIKKCKCRYLSSLRASTCQSYRSNWRRGYWLVKYRDPKRKIDLVGVFARAKCFRVLK